MIDVPIRRVDIYPFRVTMEYNNHIRSKKFRFGIRGTHLSGQKLHPTMIQSPLSRWRTPVSTNTPPTTYTLHPHPPHRPHLNLITSPTNYFGCGVLSHIFSSQSRSPKPLHRPNQKPAQKTPLLRIFQKIAHHLRRQTFHKRIRESLTVRSLKAHDNDSENVVAKGGVSRRTETRTLFRISA
ncbi:hypothetical protein BCR34DRAFT_29663 [Clohesyomyces aquaticus]|uniref:Uncharacterized protein n=1 Tax=Clohesyomyces aquaticus TaxID=1231657 RepID=A0A1Y1Z9T7_9PLEO|nr:hypothetical protein BCR34DRAFT_29663 [Clohesyomyces aquaticus]